MAEAALSGLVVLDLTHFIAGPYCTKLAAGFGATVVKVERPKTGDGMRGVGPFHEEGTPPENSIPFLWLNTGKQSVTLNLKARRGLDVFKALVKRADVLVESFSPRVMPSLGLHYEVLRAINPRLVMVSISNFGQSGPYRDYRANELELYALSGSMYATGDSARPPLEPGPEVSQYSAGLRAYAAILLALIAGHATDEGQYVDVPIMEGMLDNIETRLTDFLQGGKVSRRGGHTYAPWGLYPCRDGYATIVGAPFRHWTQGAELFDEPRLLEERYRHARDRVKHHEEVDALIEPWARSRTREEIWRAGVERSLAFGYVADLEEVLESPQHRARNFFVEMEHPTAGTYRYCSAPFKLPRSPWLTQRAPLLGEHNEVVYGEMLGLDKEDLHRMRQEGSI